MERRCQPVAESGVHTPSTLAVVTMLELRRATGGDVKSVAALEQLSFSDPWSAGEFSALLSGEHVVFLVAVSRVDSALVGYAIVSAVLEQGEVLNLAVDPARRGEGAGGALLDAGIAAAAKAGVRSVFLEVRESNRSARRLYASRGFSEISRRRRYYDKPVEDALVLRLAVQ